MQPTRRQGAGRWLAAAGLLALAAVLAVLWTRPRPAVTFDRPFEPEPFYEVHRAMNSDEGRPDRDGWVLHPEGWALGASRGLLSYQLAHEPGQRIWLDIDFDRPQGGMNRLTFRQSKTGQPDVIHLWDDADVRLRRVDLNEYVKLPGFVFLDMQAQQATPDANRPLIRRLALTFQNPPPQVDWRGAGFFLALVLVGYAGLLFAALPLAKVGWRVAGRAWHAARGLGRLALAIALLLALGALLVQPEFRREKDFDDRAALGNALILRDLGFDTAPMFFRSRIRPALVGWMLPFATLLPHQMVSSTYTPSDRQLRIFYFPDRIGPQYGLRILREQSWFTRGVFLVAALGLAGLVWRLRGGTWPALLVALGAIFCFYRAAPNVLSDVPSLLFAVLAYAAGLWAWARGGAARLAAAGLLMGFSILMKETTVIVMTALLLHQAWQTWRAASRVGSGQPAAPGSAAPGSAAPGRVWRRAVGRGAAYWALAAVLPLVWYGAVLDTGFGEIGENNSLTHYHAVYHKYVPLTWASGAADFWQVFGVLLLLVPVGLAAAQRARWGRSADRVWLCWLAGGLWIAGMQFLFPRFLVYVLPPVVYFAARGLVLLAGWGWRRLPAPWRQQLTGQPIKNEQRLAQ